MKIPNQYPPIMRKTITVQVSKGVLPQSCFVDCMTNAYGIAQCESAYQTKDPGEIASCLLTFGLGVGKWAVGLRIAQCGAKCFLG
jgi:hypothetical protein